MLDKISVNLGNTLLSMSDAIDLSNPSISAHQIRVAFIAWEMAKGAESSHGVQEKLFLAALFHDVGAMSTESKTKIHNFSEMKIDPHCVLGALLLEMSSLTAPSANMVKFHHKPWKEWQTDLYEDDTFGSQVIYLADYVERLIDRDVYILHQEEELMSKISSMSGTYLHPDLVELFAEVSHREEFWLDLVSPRLYSILLNYGPFSRTEIGVDEIFTIAPFVRSLIDFKSPFTATHTAGVAECGAALSEMFGLTAQEVSSIELAGYFHDIGKLGVPNAILEKPGKLSKKEFAVIRKHTYSTYAVLSSIGGLGPIAEWAAFHHEKLDGTGYPFRVNSERLSTGSRIMSVADIFTALKENRPYRKGMPQSKIEDILTRMARDDAVDEAVVNLLVENYDEISGRVDKVQLAAAQDYEQMVAGSV